MKWFYALFYCSLWFTDYKNVYFFLFFFEFRAIDLSLEFYFEYRGWRFLFLRFRYQTRHADTKCSKTNPDNLLSWNVHYWCVRFDLDKEQLWVIYFVEFTNECFIFEQNLHAWTISAISINVTICRNSFRFSIASWVQHRFFFINVMLVVLSRGPSNCCYTLIYWIQF